GPAQKFPTGLADLRPMKRWVRLLSRRRHRGRFFLGAVKPVQKLDPGILEHLSLSPRAIIGPGARSLEFLWWDLQAGGVSGGRYGSPASPLLWSRRSQGDGGRLHPSRDRWQSRQGVSHLLDDNCGLDCDVGVVGPEQVNARRNGGDGCVLEAGVAHLGRWWLRTGAGQCGTYQECTRPQDRR